MVHDQEDRERVGRECLGIPTKWYFLEIAIKLEPVKLQKRDRPYFAPFCTCSKYILVFISVKHNVCRLGVREGSQSPGFEEVLIAVGGLLVLHF